MTKAEKIRESLDKKFDNVEYDGDIKAIEIRFKKTGNVWRIEYFLHWGGTRHGFSGNYYTAINKNTEEKKFFKSIDSLSRAIAAGYVE